MGNAVFKMTFGDIPENYKAVKKPAFYAYVPQVVLLVILLIVGINMPQQVFDFMNNASGFSK